VVPHTALVTQLIISVAEVPGSGFVPDPAASGTALRRVVSFSSFFTIQTNILVRVAAVAPWHARRRAGSTGRAGCAWRR